MPLALQRRERHEHVGDPVAHVPVVPSLGRPRPRGQEPARVGDELAARLAWTGKRAARVAGAFAGPQHVLRRRYELPGVLRDAPFLAWPWAKLVFLGMLPTATCDMDST